MSITKGTASKLTWGLKVYIVASTDVNAERPTPKNTVLNVNTGKVGSSSTEMTYKERMNTG